MPLSEYEQRVLEQMERALTSDDPRLANTMQSAAPRSGLRWAIAAAGVVVGLLVLVLGVYQNMIWLGVGGFVVMFVGVAFAFAAPKRRTGPTGVVEEDGSTRPRPSSTSTSRKGFMNRMEERWDRRRGENGR
ncbi:Protein of unknown function (DUF3040) [Sediminihabitans luteus]|uniref:DUF3040 family protein n=1 Tax=Sediminihabitans luteus TaxID=1138585 RepID=A0A2M9CCI8_9CELL|nr:DUF3040 domain-containing protein [Sediminihabitans luteus]PJJ69070.1 Protein of unknown function (DUF3040) [Sediminihabitans luteus]GII99456.1 hypothetical protein Slu03_18340 [Sediminihabitans luteus]